MIDLSELRRAVIEQIQDGKLESKAIAQALEAPDENVLHVIRVLAGENWFKIDDAVYNSLDIWDIQPGFYDL